MKTSIAVIIIIIIAKTNSACTSQRCCLANPCTNTYCTQKNSETWISTQNFGDYSYTKLVLSSSSCMPCPYNCQTCSSTSLCNVCANGFYLSSNNSCQLCSYKCSSCVVKNSISKCSVCLAGTYLDSITASCKDCPTGATKCSSATVIAACQSGYYLTSNSMFCVSCPSNCLSCPSSNNICSSCQVGYYLNSSACFVCTVSSCSACALVSGKQFCTTCNNGYLLKSGNCSICPSNCNTCSNSTNCTSCSKGYFLIGGGCVSVSVTVSNCASYSSSTACSACSTGFYLSNGQCYPCSLLCSSCYGIHFGACTACNSLASLFNQMCLINNYLSSTLYYRYIAFPGQKALVTQGSTDCNSLLVSGTKISLNLQNLSGYQIAVWWKIFSIAGSTTYQISLINSAGTTSYSSTTSSNLGQSYLLCSSSSSLYHLDSSNQNFSSISLSNILTFQTDNSIQLALQEVVIYIQQCSSLCIQCSYTLCTRCLMTNLYTQDAYCVYSCSSGYYIYLNSSSTTNPKMCLQECPVATYPLNSNLSCMACVSPCLSCLNDKFCLSCILNYFLTQSNTCQQICPYRYFGQIQTQTCQQCIGRCLECINQQQCLNCQVGFYYASNYSCLDDCSSASGLIGMYADLTTLTCQFCSSPCLNCAISSTNCLSCLNSYYFYNSTCLASCPIKYYPDSSNICQLCQYPCQTCSLSSSNCLSCVDGYIFGNTCVSDCQIGYYEDNSQLKCLSCSSECVQCIGTAAYCLSCSIGYYWFNNQCLLSCPSHYYPNSTQLLCLSCVGACYTCSNETNCLSCKYNFLYNGQCVPRNECPLGYYADISTLNCVKCNIICFTCQYTATTCTSCQNSNTTIMYLQNNTCVSSCNNQYYPTNINSINTCQNCISPCLTCNSATVCLSCVSGYMFSNGKCGTTCSYGSYFNTTLATCNNCLANCLICTSSSLCQICQNNYFISVISPTQNQCVSSCSLGFFANLVSSSCQKCIYPCQNCSSSVDCQSCQSGILYQSRCVTSCPDTTYYDSISSTCLNCTSNCLTCKQSSSYCLSCQQNYYLESQNNTCNLECPSATYPEKITQMCLSCPLTCSSCINNTYCLTCIANLTYLNILTHSCSQSCPIGYFGNSSGQCQTCNPQCFTCLYSASNCISCSTGYLLIRLTINSLICTLSCPSSYYNQTNICYNCLFPCQTCSSSIACITCVTGTFYYGNSSSCLLTCPSNTFISEKSCILCNPPCSSCQNASVCLSCIDSLYLINGNCVTNCPSKYYSDSTRICSQCYGLCKTCSSKYYCTSCLTGYLNNGFCYSSCPAGTFANITVSECQSCISPCLECTFKSNYCTHCINGLLAYLGNCSSTCPLGSYQSGTVCLPCTFPCTNCSNTQSCSQCIGGYLLYNGLTCINNTLFCPNDFYKMDSKYCVPLALCPSNYFIDDSLKTCSSSCSREKYLNKDNKRCQYSCQAYQYVGQNMTCYNFSSTYPASLMTMSAISFIKSSIVNIVVLMNQSTIWLNNNQQFYNLEPATYSSRLLTGSNNLAYTISTSDPTLITLKANSIPTEITLNLPAYNVQSSITRYPLQNPNISISLPLYLPYSYSQIYQGKIASQFGQGISWFILLLSIFFLLKNRLSDLYILWDTVQLLYVLLFLDIQYPPTLNQFLLGLANTMLVSFPNIFPLNSTRTISDRSFYAYSYDNNFVRNSGSSITLLLIVIFIYLFCKLLEYLIKNIEFMTQFANQHPLFKKIVYQLLLRYRWHYASDIFFITYLNVFLFGAAQIYYLQSNSSNIFSNVLCILSFLLYLSFPIFVGHKLYKHFPNISKGKMVDNLKCFYRGIQRTNKFGVFLILVRYFRKMVYCIVIAVFSSSPMYALPILMFTSILMGLFIFIYVPFQKRLSNVVQTLTEVCLSILFLAIAIINFNNQNKNKDFNSIIGFLCCCLLIFILFMLVFQIFCKTLFHLEEETPKIKKKSDAKDIPGLSESELRKKAGEFFDFIFPKLKMNFKFGDDSEDEVYHYQQGDSQNSQNNEQRQRSWGIESSKQQQSDQFRHYDNSSNSSQTNVKQKEKAPVYLIRCVKQLK